MMSTGFNGLKLRYLLILLPFIAIVIFFLSESDARSNVQSKVTTLWEKVKPNDQPIPHSSQHFTNVSEKYVAACVAVKDQPKDLPEFLVHHYHNVGIRHFYLMDDGSEPPLSTVEDYGIPNSAITHQYFNKSFTAGRIMQPIIYNICISKWGNRHTWFAFIDVDEFFHVPGPEKLVDILQPLESNKTVGALGVNWRTHTSNGFLTRQNSVRRTFTTCITDNDGPGGIESDNKHIKSIVKSSSYIDPESPHSFHLRDGAETVGEHGDIIDKPPTRFPITRDRIGLHNYAVKSKEEYEEKITRSNANQAPMGWDWWDHIEKEMEHVPCYEMTKYQV